MSFIFRTVAASTKTLPQAHTFAGVIVLAVIIYTGYIIPRPSMHPVRQTSFFELIVFTELELVASEKQLSRHIFRDAVLAGSLDTLLNYLIVVQMDILV